MQSRAGIDDGKALSDCPERNHREGQEQLLRECYFTHLSVLLTMTGTTGHNLTELIRLRIKPSAASRDRFLR